MELRMELQHHMVVDCIALNCEEQIMIPLGAHAEAGKCRAPRQSDSEMLCQDCWTLASTTHTYHELVFGS